MTRHNIKTKIKPYHQLIPTFLPHSATGSAKFF